MSDAAPPTPSPGAAPRRGNSYGFTLGLVVLLVAAAGGVYAYFKYVEGRVEPVDEVLAISPLLAEQAPLRKMAAGYADEDGDLVADPPEPAKLVKPTELVFTGIVLDDPEKAQDVWKDFLAALQKAAAPAGVKAVRFDAETVTTKDQLDRVRDGKIHVTAFQTGLVPGAVNTAGFVPLFCPADAGGRYGYEMEVLVPAGSPVRSPADLRGKTLGFSTMSSNSGAKAPMVLLKDEHGMLPGRDYRFKFLGDLGQQVKALAGNQADAVFVASDFYAAEAAAGRVKADGLRSVHKSKTFPPLCFGVPHTLHPDVVARVKEAFAGFQIAGTSVAARQQAARFAPVDYKRDWEYVRQIDDSLGRLVPVK